MHGDRRCIPATKVFFYCLISYIWQKSGTWVYADNKKNEEMNITVPLSDDSDAPIDHLSNEDMTEALGISTCPFEKAKRYIASMENKAQEWIHRTKDGNM